jgi:hypothetical protein
MRHCVDLSIDLDDNTKRYEAHNVAFGNWLLKSVEKDHQRYICYVMIIGEVDIGRMSTTPFPCIPDVHMPPTYPVPNAILQR